MNASAPLQVIVIDFFSKSPTTDLDYHEDPNHVVCIYQNGSDQQSVTSSTDAMFWLRCLQVSSILLLLYPTFHVDFFSGLSCLTRPDQFS